MICTYFYLEMSDFMYVLFTLFILPTFIGTRNVLVTMYCFKLYSEIDWIYIINVFMKHLTPT